MKYYFDTEGTYGYPLSFWKQHMLEAGLQELTLHSAEPDRDTHEFFFCTYYGEVGSKEETSCGRSCSGYNPCNGVKGKCRYQKRTFVSGDQFLLTYKDQKFELRKLKKCTSMEC